MKKTNLKVGLCGFLAGVIASAAVPALAYNGTMSITAAFKNIKIYIDGAEFTPRDASGNVLEPFIYNGSTYLPIRAVGEAVGKSVSYDANTNSVYLGSSGSSSVNTSSVSGTKLMPYDFEEGKEDNITMGGKLYENGFYLDAGYHWARDVNETNGVAYFNVSGNYNTVSGLFGSVDDTGNADAEAFVKFYGDGILIKEYNIEKGQLPQNFTINVSGISQLRVEVGKSNESFPGLIGFAEVYIK